MKLSVVICGLLSAAKAELCESNVVGYEGDNVFSNLNEIESIDYTKFSIHEITHCEDPSSEDLIGAKYSLIDDNGVVQYLSPFGDMNGTC